jgi:hypothetical protein
VFRWKTKGTGWKLMENDFLVYSGDANLKKTGGLFMALLDRPGPAGRRRMGKGKPWWEVAEEFPPEALYDPTEEADPMGSYTGVPEDGGAPVQDADDL